MIKTNSFLSYIYFLSSGVSSLFSDLRVEYLIGSFLLNSTCMNGTLVTFITNIEGVVIEFVFGNLTARLPESLSYTFYAPKSKICSINDASEMDTVSTI